MPRIRVLPYKQGSRSASVLAQALGGKVLRLENSRFRPRRDDIVINWGRSERTPLLQRANMINSPEIIRNASNKLQFFNGLREADADIIPAFWTRREDIPAEAFPIVCRTVLAGHSGAGIVIAATADELVNAPLYVQYIKKQTEYRVHVGRVEGRKNPDKIISVQRKARRREVPDEFVNWQIRNYDNGFTYAREDVRPPSDVLDGARRALIAVGVDFGAVDVVWRERDSRAFVLELNTAPGLAGSTVDDYVRYFAGVTR